jgi:hypothetical protein
MRIIFLNIIDYEIHGGSNFRSKMESSRYEVEPVGFVRSVLTRLEDAPMQGDEGAPEAWLELIPLAAPGRPSAGR